MSTDDDYYNYTSINESAIYAIIIGTISAIFPLSVVFILLYKYDKLMRGRSFIKYVFVIAICDSITSLSIAIGYPSNTIICHMQGFISIFFGRASIFFTTVLMFQLFYVIVYRQYFLTVKHMHAIVWPINIILQLIPYMLHTNYGIVYHPNLPPFAVERCYIADKRGLSLNSYLVNLPIVLSFAFVGFLSIIIFAYSYWSVRNDPTNAVLLSHIRDSQSTVILYPIAMLACYTPGN